MEDVWQVLAVADMSTFLTALMSKQEGLLDGPINVTPVDRHVPHRPSQVADEGRNGRKLEVIDHVLRNGSQDVEAQHTTRDIFADPPLD